MRNYKKNLMLANKDFSIKCKVVLRLGIKCLFHSVTCNKSVYDFYLMCFFIFIIIGRFSVFLH